MIILLPLPSEGDVLSVGVTSNGSPYPHTVCALLYESWIFDDRVNQLMFILVSPQYGSVLHETNVSKVTVSFTDLALLQ